MLERYNPILRLLCLALIGLVLYQASKMTLRRDVIARSSFETPVIAKKVDVKPVDEGKSAKSTNTPAGGAAKNPSVPGMPRGGGPGGGGSPLPSEIQASIDKIKTSGLLGPDVKPPPMALLGIAGKDVFLRAPNGQTGLIREGEELGGVKLIKIGTNRVLVEENKQQKELTIFSGFGSETLMQKEAKK